MKNLNNSLVKTSDMVPEVFVKSISKHYSWQFILCNSGVNLRYKCLKINENMKNLNRSSVKASDMHGTNIYVYPISAQLFLAIFLTNSRVN